MPTLMIESDTQRIEQIVAEWPAVDLSAEHRSVVEQMARRWLEMQARSRQRMVVRDIERRSNTTTPRESPRAKVEAATRNAVNSIARDRAAAIRQTWLSELLTATFALPDGRRVTFGAATIAEHEEYANMLEGQAAGSLETAALHRRAVNDIRAGHVHTLAELEPNPNI